MIHITSQLFLSENEIEYSFISSPGPGGQNVNKVATAVLLRFNVLQSSSLPADIRERLLLQLGKRLTKSGCLIIKSSRFRTQARNKADAEERLIDIIRKAVTPPKKRRKTRPTLGSIERRLKTKKVVAKKKQRRQQKLEE